MRKIRKGVDRVARSHRLEHPRGTLGVEKLDKGHDLQTWCRSCLGARDMTQSKGDRRGNEVRRLRSLNCLKKRILGSILLKLSVNSVESSHIFFMKAITTGHGFAA